MNNLYKILSFLILGGAFFTASAEQEKQYVEFEPVIKYRACETPGFMNAYCDTSVTELYKRYDEIDTVHIYFFLDKDFPATNDAEFNSNLLKLMRINDSIVIEDTEGLEDDYYYIADSIVAKVTSYNDSTLSMLIKQYYYQWNNGEWRTKREETINFDKRTKSRIYINLEDSISMWSKPDDDYAGESYSISDYLITVHHYVPEPTSGTAAGHGDHTRTTIVDRNAWVPIFDNEIIWCDKPIDYIKACQNTFLNFLMTVKLAGDGCAHGDSATNKRFDISECHEEDHWYIDADDPGTAGAYGDGITIFLDRCCPQAGWYEAPVSFTYDEIYEFLIPGTAVYEAAENYCKTHKPTQFDKEYYGDSDSSRVRSLYIDFDTKSIETTDNIYEISFPASLQKAKKLSKTWCWVDPDYYNHNSNRKGQRGKEIRIPKKIKYEGFHAVSDKGDAEISVRIFTNLVKDYPELIPTLTESSNCNYPDFHEYDLPGEKLSKQYIYRCIDTESNDLIEIDIRCLPERAFYYEIASYMMFNCFNLEEYNEHYMLK